MDAFKLNRLRDERPDIGPDDIRQLRTDEILRLKNQLAKRLALASSGDALALMLALRSRRTPLAGPNAESPEFDLRLAFRTAAIEPPRRVLVNWGRLDEIDSVSFEVLGSHVDDFWYPKANDLDFFDESCDWVLSIDYEGYVWLARL